MDEASFLGKLPGEEVATGFTDMASIIEDQANKVATSVNIYKESIGQISQFFINFKKEMETSFLGALKSATTALSTDLADGLLEGKSALESFQDFFKTMVKKLIAEAIRLSIIQPILSAIFGAFVPGKTLDFTGGTPTIKPKASGGQVSSSTPYMVGEQGPELFVPSTNGNITPNNDLNSGSSPVTNNYITNNINAMDSRSVAQVFAENSQTLLGTVEFARKQISYGI